MTTLQGPADPVTWVEENTPDLTESARRTLLVFARHADRTGKGSFPTKSTVIAGSGRGKTQAKLDVRLLLVLGLLVPSEERPADWLALPTNRRPSVYDLPMRQAEQPDELDLDATWGWGPTPKDTPTSSDQLIPQAAQYIAAESILRNLNEDGARLYAADAHRMIRLIAQGLANGWEHDALVQFLDKANREIFEPGPYLLFVMTRNQTPPWSPQALYTKDPVPVGDIAGLVDRLIVHLNTARLTFDMDQVTAARDLFNAALATGMPPRELMLLIEEPTTWRNPGDELLARVQTIVPGRPRPPAVMDRPKLAASPTKEQLDRRELSAGIAKIHQLEFDQDQARVLDYFLRIAILNGWTHADLFTHAARPLDGLDFPAVELVERYRGLGAKR